MSLRGYKKKWGPALHMLAFPPKPIAIESRTLNRKPRTRIRAVSKSKAADKRKYRERVKVWLTEPANVVCKACRPIMLAMIMHECGSELATQCHHKHGRGWNGELLLYEPLWIPVCCDCHDWIHRNKTRAREINLLAPKGQWNEKP